MSCCGADFSLPRDFSPVSSDHSVIAVLGPTGAGKSDLALSLAETFNGEIVNCDSVQLYRYLDIGTARTPPEARRGIPHHLIEVLDPDQHFTAGDYARQAERILREVAGRGRIPVLVGGTGFYVRALLQGLSESPARDTALRERLARRPPGSVYRLLTRFDPAAAARIHPNDSPKLIRALEVCILSRKPMTSLFETSPVRKLEGFRIIRIGLDPDREELAARLDARCARMFSAGLIDEVRRVLAMGFPPESNALKSIGYKESLLHIKGEISLDAAIALTQAATRRYAKRQRTWFRREPDMFWIHAFGTSEDSFAIARELVRDRLK